MKPILYSANETDFSHCGLGVLNDCISCEVYEELNGQFELTIRYPVNGVLFEELSTDKIIVAKPSKTRENQAFRIYSVKKTSNNSATIKAEHVSYRLKDIIVKPIAASTLGRAFEHLKNNAYSGEHPFVFESEIDTSEIEPFSVGSPTSIKKLLADEDYSVRTVWGGELEYDNYTVWLRNKRGVDNGFRIAYAKNMTGITCQETMQDVYTACVAYYQGVDENNNEIVVVSDMQFSENPLSYNREMAYDASAEYDYTPSVENLNITAQEFLAKADKEPYLIVSVDFVNLGDSEEYKAFKKLETVEIGDTVKIYHPLYNIDISARVVSTTFDALMERYTSVDVGRRKVNISDTLSGVLAKLY